MSFETDSKSRIAVTTHAYDDADASGCAFVEQRFASG